MPKENLKKNIGTSVASGIVGAAMLLGGTQVVDKATPEEYLSEKIQQQEASLIIDGKYKQFETEKFGELDVEIHEYVSTKGAGYHILLKEKREDGIYTKTQSVGIEEEDRSTDWVLTIPTNPLATSTIKTK